MHQCGHNCRYCQMANLLLPHHESDDEDHVNLGDASVQSDTNIAASQPSRPPTPSESQGNITMAMKRYRTRHNTLALLPKVFVLPQHKPVKRRPPAKPLTAEKIESIRKQIESQAVCLPDHIRKACCWDVASPPRSISVLVELCESFALRGCSIIVLHLAFVVVIWPSAFAATPSQTCCNGETAIPLSSDHGSVVHIRQRASKVRSREWLRVQTPYLERNQGAMAHVSAVRKMDILPVLRIHVHLPCALPRGQVRVIKNDFLLCALPPLRRYAHLVLWSTFATVRASTFWHHVHLRRATDSRLHMFCSFTS